MKTIKQLEVLQEHIGKEFTASPSPYMKWLRPVVLKAEQGHYTMGLSFTQKKRRI